MSIPILSASAAEFVPMETRSNKVLRPVRVEGPSIMSENMENSAPNSAPILRTGHSSFEDSTRTPLGGLTDITNIMVSDSDEKLSHFKPRSVQGFQSLAVAKIGSLGLFEDLEDAVFEDDLGTSSSVGEPSIEAEHMTVVPEASLPDGRESRPELDEVSVSDLPSIGSALHGTGECKRCNFFSKGRCQNGLNCSFCHFPHDKRKPSRQEKRERKAAWLAQGEGEQAQQAASEQTTSAQMWAQPAAEEGAARNLSAGKAARQVNTPRLHSAMMDDKDFQQTMAHSVLSSLTSELDPMDAEDTMASSALPGLPPRTAMKLPSHLAFPPACTSAPPGLAPVQHYSHWQRDTELQAAHRRPGHFVQPLATSPMMDHHGLQSMVSSIPCLMSTPLSSIPMPPRVKNTCTVATQTAETEVEGAMEASETYSQESKTSFVEEVESLDKSWTWSRHQMLRCRVGVEDATSIVQPAFRAMAMAKTCA
eukprot:CAMPEP_0170650380 /NCGR_PEP_ID=MMETSP0224-20130122/45774_1 /TAXON_ID=285029 /ORGANISM="Togula jolla, Strain CCCM 725" /LENGTH=477 /DNA_ID=CAMNT_0010982043 /DNA_START=15 /DNA_END=1448 /DNA_ORIENTATION=-